MSNRRGFTIVEIVVAIVVLSVGLLGLVTTAALVSRMIAQGQRYSLASTLANRRLEKLSAVRCSGMSNGADTVGRIVVTWTVSDVNSGGGKKIVMTVVTPTGRGNHTDLFTSTVACL